MTRTPPPAEAWVRRLLPPAAALAALLEALQPYRAVWPPAYLGDLCVYRTAALVHARGGDPWEISTLLATDAGCRPGGPFLYPAWTLAPARALLVGSWADTRGLATTLGLAVLGAGLACWVALPRTLAGRTRAAVALLLLTGPLARVVSALVTHGNVAVLEAGLLGLAALALARGAGASGGALLAVAGGFKAAPLALATWLVGRPRTVALRGLATLGGLVALGVVVEFVWGPVLPFRGLRMGAARGVDPAMPSLVTVIGGVVGAVYPRHLVVATLLVLAPLAAVPARVRRDPALWLPLVALAWAVVHPKMPDYGWVLAWGPLAAAAARWPVFAVVVAGALWVRPEHHLAAGWGLSVAGYVALLAACLGTLRRSPAPAPPGTPPA